MNLKPISECILELFFVKTESGPSFTQYVKQFHFESTSLGATMTLNSQEITPSNHFSNCGLWLWKRRGKEEETEQFICSLKQRCTPYQHAKLSKGKRERLDQRRISNSPKQPEHLSHNPTKSRPSFLRKKKNYFPSH